MKTRHGSSKDEEDLEDLMEGLLIKVQVERDQTADAIRQTVETFSKQNQHKDSEISVVAVLSHGNKDGVCGRDGKMVAIEDILDFFKANKSPSLEDKPKLFIFQACRGSQLDSDDIPASPGLIAGQATSKPSKGPNFRDMLVVKSSPQSYKSFRHPHSGSFLIQSICDVFSRKAFDTEVRDLLDEVYKQVAEMGGDSHKQCVAIEVYGFCKKLFFNPGIHGEISELIKRYLKILSCIFNLF